MILLQFQDVAKHNVRNTAVMEAFGKKVLAIRTEKGMTQESLAFEAGISQVQIARIEAGSINTTISSAYAIAKALGVKASELFDF